MEGITESAVVDSLYCMSLLKIMYKSGRKAHPIATTHKRIHKEEIWRHWATPASSSHTAALNEKVVVRVRGGFESSLFVRRTSHFTLSAKGT